MHQDKNASIKFVAEFVGEERETAPAAAPVRAAELRAAGVAVLWAGIDAAPADEGEAAGSSACAPPVLPSPPSTSMDAAPASVAAAAAADAVALRTAVRAAAAAPRSLDLRSADCSCVLVC